MTARTLRYRAIVRIVTQQVGKTSILVDQSMLVYRGRGLYKAQAIAIPWRRHGEAAEAA
jgi:hypothetical protein